MRVELADLVARYGPDMGPYGKEWPLIDAQERCRLVACNGAAFYLASETYGGPWRKQLADERLRETLPDAPAPATAQTLTRQTQAR